MDVLSTTLPLITNTGSPSVGFGTLNDGVLLVVILSLLLTPVSVASVISGAVAGLVGTLAVAISGLPSPSLSVGLSVLVAVGSSALVTDSSSLLIPSPSLSSLPSGVLPSLVGLVGSVPTSFSSASVTPSLSSSSSWLSGIPSLSVSTMVLLFLAGVEVRLSASLPAWS